MRCARSRAHYHRSLQSPLWGATLELILAIIGSYPRALWMWHRRQRIARGARPLLSKKRVFPRRRTRSQVSFSRTLKPARLPKHAPQVAKMPLAYPVERQPDQVSGSSGFEPPMALHPPNAAVCISSAPLLRHGGGALADFFECRFEATKLLRAQFRENILHLPGMLSKGCSNEFLSAWREGHDPNAPVLGALDPAYQALRYEALDSDTDRAWGGAAG